MNYFLFENESDKLLELLPAEGNVLRNTGLGSCIGVLDEDQSLSGYCLVFPSWSRGNMLCLHDIKVAKDDRRQGIASELLVQAGNLAVSQGAEKIGTYVELKDEPTVFKQFIDSQDFQVSEENIIALDYEIAKLKDSKIMAIAASNKNAFPEVKPIENPELDIMKRFAEKAQKQKFYFDRYFYDPMMTMFCVKDNDVIGAMSLELLANGNIRIANTFVDKSSKEALILPAMIATAIELTNTYFGENVNLEIFVQTEDLAQKLITVLGEPKERKNLAFYSSKLS